MVPEGAPVLEASVAFGRLLRRAGLRTGPDRVMEFVRALDKLDISRREDVYWAGRATLCSRPEDVEPYDRAFSAFWEKGAASGMAHPRMQRAQEAALDSVGPPKRRVLEDPEGQEAVRLRYSPVERLREKDFSTYTPEEFEELRRLLAGVGLEGPPRRSRRPVRAGRGDEDLRATLREALRTGGEPVRRRFRRAGSRPRRVVLLCDISGSMEPYSRALMRFMHAGVLGGAPLEAFALGTRLTRLTRQLSTHDPDTALDNCARAVEDWSGGTRLGDTLKEFVDLWGQRGMARGAVVVILSDGWDTGDAGVLGEQMARMGRLAYKIIWVNPLKAAPGYRPVARGMAAALPYVDVFLPGHNLESLQELSWAISGAMYDTGGSR